MFINTDCENFVPKDFAILNFYGINTCFAWNENEFVSFPYLFKDSTEKLKVLRAPAKIKDIRGFKERVFILCSPSGIYKLTDSFKFASLSQAGIEVGSDFCEVFKSSNGILILEDKKQKSSKNLFSLSPTGDVQVLSLNYDSSDETLRRALSPDNPNSANNLCIIIHDRKLFKMSDQMVQLIYSCDYLLKKIEPIQKCGKVTGAILQTDTTTAILMYVLDNKLKYDTIFLEANAQTLRAVYDVNVDNALLLIYSDNKRTYYMKKMLFVDSVPEVRTEEKRYESIKIYHSKSVLFLNDSKELFQMNVEQLVGRQEQNTSDYVELQLGMLEDLGEINSRICDKMDKLSILTERMTEKEDELRRINVFVNKKQFRYCPKDSVIRLLNQVFLISNFETVLPENTIVVRMLKSVGKTIFSMKSVKNYETIVEMPISIPNLSSKLYITADLITYKRDGKVWCLIKDYIQDPLPSKSNKVRLTTDQKEFVKYKLAVLKHLKKEQNVSMEVLSGIKRDLRSQIQLMQ